MVSRENRLSFDNDVLEILNILKYCEKNDIRSFKELCDRLVDEIRHCANAIFSNTDEHDYYNSYEGAYKDACMDGANYRFLFVVEHCTFFKTYLDEAAEAKDDMDAVFDDDLYFDTYTEVPDDDIDTEYENSTFNDYDDFVEDAIQNISSGQDNEIYEEE